MMFYSDGLVSVPKLLEQYLASATITTLCIQTAVAVQLHSGHYIEKH